MTLLMSVEATASLSRSMRIMIALGAAKGLAFLHNAERPLVYRVFKTSNILLDSVSFYSSTLGPFLGTKERNIMVMNMSHEMG